MLNLLRKVVFAFVLTLLVVSSGFLPSPTAAYAADGVPKIPLASEVTWNNIGQTDRNLQLNIQGDALTLSGQTYVASEKFTGGIAPEVLDFYSNVELYKSGWVSDNSWEDEDGTHLVFYHEAGYYLAIDFIKCADDPAASCVTVWGSVQKDAGIFTKGPKVDSQEVGDAALFIKKTPANNSTGINPLSTFLSWNTYAGTQKYSYCIGVEASNCTSADKNWTGTYLNTSIILANLNPSKVYYWQVKAIYDLNPTPKKYVLADGGTVWKFTTSIGSVRISGNAGVSGATLNWVDSYAKTTTADSSGNYSFYVRYNWSGTVIPSKTGYTFNPVSRAYTDLTTNQTFQNYLATNGVTISGNAGIAGSVMHYTVGGVAKTVTSSSSGNYVVTVPKDWSGTVTPTKTGYTFTPASRSYASLAASVTSQNYVAKITRYTIKGDVGIAGAKLTYVDGTTKYVTSDVSGNYTIFVPYNWSGRVTPSKTGMSVIFVPAYKSYTSVKANIVGQNYQANIRLILRSNGAFDGHIREASEFSSTGGVLNSPGSSFVIGDSAANEQYLAILSFDTSVLPNTAKILSAKLKITMTGISGSNPMTTHGSIIMGIKTPYFGIGPSLELVDFNSLESGACGIVSKVPTGNVYTGVFTPTGMAYIGKTSLTQLRIRFSLDDNNDNIANYVRFASGDAAIVADRPALDIVYYVP